jgi:hypothetical protein
MIPRLTDVLHDLRKMEATRISFQNVSSADLAVTGV